ncbi:hypothetical protein PM1_009 [Pectobacterium phage PM1]|uniref:Uncharacterized protein n=1 Tax=Pectobacterium phage PM1 TaxID=1399915 RepID=X2CSW1_9CAUD|nr:hypothetical protein PM1_009 [Pectobacterium phage PM1]AGV99225.1 hypothetical protein PM1_009 [Pectobacterium phage PM1]
METLILPARDIVAGDVVYYKGVWYVVERNYLHTQSPYAKMNLLEEGKRSKISLYVKFGLAHPFTVKQPVAVMQENQQKALGVVQCLQRQLEQHIQIEETPADAVGNVSFGTAITINKEVLLGTSRTEMRASANKLLELVKKL